MPYHPGYRQGSLREDVVEARVTLVLAGLACLAAVALALDLGFADTVNSWSGSGRLRSTTFALSAALGVMLSLLVLALSVFGAVYAIGTARATSHRVRSLSLVAAAVCVVSLLVLVAVSVLSL